MPLAPELQMCPDCNIGTSLLEVKLKCEACDLEQSVKIDEVYNLPSNWPLCHGEFMSLQTRTKCPQCDKESTDYFPNGRLSLDCLPGTYNRRVFIGGNYASISDLREIKKAVYELGADFTPIIPYDDFQIPQGQVYETDLRLLHNCKYAIFEVTQPGGELFEIARCSEYGVITLLMYQARGLLETPPNVKTMLLESGVHEHHSYMDSGQMRRIADEFLQQKNPTQWKRAVSLMGYKFEKYYVHNKLNIDGTAEHKLQLTGLKVMIPDLRISEITHEFRITSGNIEEGTFDLQGPVNAKWFRDNSTSGPSAEVGVVRFDPPLDDSKSIVNYSFTLRTRNAYNMLFSQLAETDRSALPNAVEYSSRTNLFHCCVFRL